MRRPVMNPSYFDDAHGSRRRRPRLDGLWRIGRILLRVLFFNPLARGRETFRMEVGGRFSRLVRSAAYRLAFLPLLLVMTVAVLVFAATHPPQQAPSMDPGAEGLFFEPVSFVSADGTRLEGWLIPVLSAQRILIEGEQALRQKHPAVVLVHDYGASKQQMLPMMRPLHEAGIIVLAVSLRGSGSSAAAAHTFGLRERQDVGAAVELLRRRPGVDPSRIALVGVGSGATACVLAGRSDGGIKAMVLETPPEHFQQVLVERLGPRQPWMQWLNPLCKWSFEIAYQVNSDDVSLATHLEQQASLLIFESREGHPALLRSGHLEEATRFLEQALRPAD